MHNDSEDFFQLPVNKIMKKNQKCKGSELTCDDKATCCVTKAGSGCCPITHVRTIKIHLIHSTLTFIHSTLIHYT